MRPLLSLVRTQSRLSGRESLRRHYSSSPATLQTSPFGPRHLLSIADLSGPELTTLIRNAFIHKQAHKSGTSRLSKALAGRTIAVMFSKRSTRTRVSTDSAVAAMGGHPMFLGRDDIQLGVWYALLSGGEDVMRADQTRAVTGE